MAVPISHRRQRRRHAGRLSRGTRLALERLEDRNAPSALGPRDDNGNGHGHGNGNGDDHGPPPPAPVGVSIGISSGVNAHGSFNGSTITDSFNNTINNTVVLMPSQQAALQGLLGLSGFLASTLNSPQLGTLLNDEIALAVDSYLTSPGISGVLPAGVVSSLKSDEATLTAAINANPVNASPIGHALGTLAFNTTLDAFTTAQATI